jgi:hypothetical protein
MSRVLGTIHFILVSYQIWGHTEPIRGENQIHTSINSADSDVVEPQHSELTEALKSFSLLDFK